jgi:SAM-dependent methyltransferase
MPINLVHSWFHRVEKGWDPISPEYALDYDKHATSEIDTRLLERLAQVCQGFTGRRVLDLGGGPGHYSVQFARLGADVIWHDPSRVYQRIAMDRCKSSGVLLSFSLGYLEEARKFGNNAFDVVFCRVCWYYSRDDRSFARLISSLLKPGGVGYIECNISGVKEERFLRRAQVWCNNNLWIKIGHPLPPRGRIAKLMQRFPISFLEADYRCPDKDRVVFIKA